MDLMTVPAAPATRPLAASAPAIPGGFAGEPAADYDIVRHAIEFISEEWRDQPSLETIAEAVGLKPLALQRLFTRWAGLSPKGFLQAVTLDHARSLLADSASILDAILGPEG